MLNEIHYTKTKKGWIARTGNHTAEGKTQQLAKNNLMLQILLEEEPEVPEIDINNYLQNLGE